MKTIKAKLKPYNTLSGNFTKHANTMVFHIPDAYCYKVYSYLCLRYNCNYNYAFPSYTTMARDLNISVTKIQKCINWLCEQKYIVKAKYENAGKYNNIYYIRYLEIDEKSVEEVFTEDIEIQVEDGFDDIINVEIEV